MITNGVHFVIVGLPVLALRHRPLAGSSCTLLAAVVSPVGNAPKSGENFDFFVDGTISTNYLLFHLISRHLMSEQQYIIDIFYTIY